MKTPMQQWQERVITLNAIYRRMFDALTDRVKCGALTDQKRRQLADKLVRQFVADLALEREAFIAQQDADDVRAVFRA